MKRAGFLLEQIAEPENLRIAFWRASKGKTDKLEVLKYQTKFEENIKKLREQILRTTLDIGHYNIFTIYEPKERIICAASFPERVLHYAIINICYPYFEKFQIYDSYATRIDKGTFAAIDRAKIFTKNNTYFLKLDVRKYFNSISHPILVSLLKHKFKDKKLLEILEQIIDSYSISESKGLPIGNLTSQYFANYYLAFLDHYIKESLQVKCFVRYMDDMVLWNDSKNILKDNLKKIKQYLNENLDLTLKQELLNLTSNGLPFLGFVLRSAGMRISSNSKRRFLKKYRNYENKLLKNVWSEQEYQNHILPLLDFVKKADTYHFRKILFEGNNQ